MLDGHFGQPNGLPEKSNKYVPYSAFYRRVFCADHRAVPPNGADSQWQIAISALNIASGIVKEVSISGVLIISVLATLVDGSGVM